MNQFYLTDLVQVNCFIAFRLNSVWMDKYKFNLGVHVECMCQVGMLYTTVYSLNYV